MDKETWEKELEERTWLKPMSIKELKAFINPLLKSQTQDIIKKVEGMKIEFIPYTKYTGLLNDIALEKQKMINHGERCYNKAIQKFNQALSAILKEL